MLFKTKNSSLSPHAPFNPKFVFLHKSGSEYLQTRGILALSQSSAMRQR